MNILISGISAFAKAPKSEYQYEIRIEGQNDKWGTIKAFHTNESIIKCLGKVLTPENQINKLVALTTNIVESTKNDSYDGLTAYEYISNIAREEFGEELIIEKVAIEDLGDSSSERPTCDIIDDICNKIDVDDVVYLDTAGGARNTINIIQVLTQILRYKGIETKMSLYSNAQNATRFITDTYSFDKLSKLAAAFNEFMTSGKSTLLGKCLDSSNTYSDAYKNMVESMNRFSENMMLAQIDNLDDTIKNLQESIDKCDKESSDRAGEIEHVIIKQFIPIIKSKLLGDSYDKIDYIAITKWCLDNDLIQQAITIFVEKIPICLFEKGSIVYLGDIDKSKKEFEESKSNPLMSRDWETKTFYNDFMESKKTVNEGVEELKRCLREKRRHSENKEVERVLRDIYSYDMVGNNESRITNLLAMWKKEKGWTSADKMINNIWCNQKYLIELLGIEPSKEEDTLTKKFRFVDDVVLKKNRTIDFKWSNNLHLAIYGYLYAKSIRNSINHASSESKCTEEQMSILKKYGYDFSAFDIKTLKGNMYTALKSIEGCSAAE